MDEIQFGLVDGGEVLWKDLRTYLLWLVYYY